MCSSAIFARKARNREVVSTFSSDVVSFSFQWSLSPMRVVTDSSQRLPQPHKRMGGDSVFGGDELERVSDDWGVGSEPLRWCFGLSLTGTKYDSLSSVKCSFVAADVNEVSVAVDAESFGCCVSCFWRWNGNERAGGGGGGWGDMMVRESNW